MRSQAARKQLSATNARNLRTLLLLNVFEPEEIGARIAEARERAGLRQEDLADLVGVSTRSIQGYEAGSTKPYKHLRAIAAATGVTQEHLLGTEATPRDDVAEILERLGRIEEKLARLPDSQADSAP